MQFIDPQYRVLSWQNATWLSFEKRAQYHDVEFIVGKEQKSFFCLKGELARHSEVFTYVLSYFENNTIVKYNQ